MEFVHKPVLYEESLVGLNIKPDGIYVDGTTGGGGHSAGIAGKLNENGILICIDQDIEAITSAKSKVLSANIHGARVIFENSNFSNIRQILDKHSISGIDGLLLDIGVSSYQLDNPDRGFSYNYEGKLDMRMNAETSLTAEEMVNRWSRKELSEVIKNYGEEKWATRIAEFIVKTREEGPIKTTTDLVEIIKAAIPAGARREGPHPAKRTFQALRIAVNDELGVLERTIHEGAQVIKSGGRFCIITFHSLEDRIVKNAFGKMVRPCECPSGFPVCVCGKKPIATHVWKKPIGPNEGELGENPRARSAKLRAVEIL